MNAGVHEAHTGQGAHILNNLAIITRANFLPLTVVIVSAGLAASFYAYRVFSALDAFLVLIGALLTHAAVNVFNNYFDYRSRIDERTTKTPFSGGVDILVKGKMKPSTAFGVGLACLLGAAGIGVYFLARKFYPLFPILLYGLIVICLYTPVLSKIHALSEIIAGSGFGFMGLGVYVTQTRVIDGTGISVFVPVSILVALLLFLNEFPDAEADKASGRRHLVILLGKRRSAWVYIIGLAATYASILLAFAMQLAPVGVLISFMTTPIACKAGRIALKSYDRTPELVPALAMNVVVILSTILLLAVGFLIGLFV
jgi:1,4-dihydroxy-2-naphthoate octaprenyltransferase